MKPKADVVPTPDKPKFRSTERRHNRSQRKKGLHGRGQCTPGYESIKLESHRSTKCARCGVDLKSEQAKVTIHCDRCDRDIWAIVKQSTRKFPPLQRRYYAPGDA